METEQIMEKIRNFLDKKLELSPKDCFFITKELSNEYYSDVVDEASEEEGDEEYGLEADTEEETESEEAVRPVKQPQKFQPPQIKVKNLGKGDDVKQL